MSEEIPDVISPLNGSNSETAMTALDTGGRHEDEQVGPNDAASSQNNESALDDVDNEEEPRRPLAADSEDDDDDDGIQVTIGNFEVEASTFAANRLKSRGMLPGGPIVPQIPPAAPTGPINGQPNFDHDALNAYKDEDKPWKKPGADITDYFNYGFTDETWAKYSDRQRRLRYENSLARLNPVHVPPMYLGHPPMMHPINPHPGMMMNRPFNPQMVPRPMTNRRPDGRIDVIGTTDQTSRRAMMDTPNGFDPPSNTEGHTLPNGQPVDVHHSGPAASNGTPADGVRHIPTLAAHRPPMMPMPFRPGYGHAPGSPHFFRYGPGVEMHGDRFPRPYFVPRHPHPGWNNGMGPRPGFPPGSALPPGVGSENAHDPRAGSGRGATPENDASRSSTPEEKRPVDENGSALTTADEQEKSTAEDQFKDRYRDDRDRHYSSRHTRHRGSEHEYERPRNDRRSSRERDDKYGSSSRRRNGRGDDEPSRSQRSSRRTPTKRESSPSKVSSTELSQSSSANAPSSPNDRSRHSQHKKSSKRSRHDSDSERSSSRHHHSHRRRSSDKSSSSNKRAKHHTDPSADHTEPFKA